MQKSFRSHSGVIENFFRSLSELVQNSLKKSLMGHAGVDQNSFRTPSELIQKAFRVIQDSLSLHSEFVQNLVRSHSGFIQNSHSECIWNNCRTHSELIQKTFKNHSRAIHELSRCLPGVLRHSIGTHSELATQMYQVRSRRTNSRGYKFI